MENQGPGLLACDEGLFDRVWDRVKGSENPPLTVFDENETGSDGSGRLQDAVGRSVTDLGRILTDPEPSAAPLATPVPPANATAAALQQWVLRLLGDSEAYRTFASKNGRNRSLLNDLAKEKRQQARALAAEYFLRTGVRYWPRDTVQTAREMPVFPSIRWFYLTERRQEADLRAQAAQEEPELANRYLAISEAARSAANRLRNLLESLF